MTRPELISSILNSIKYGIKTYSMQPTMNF